MHCDHCVRKYERESVAVEAACIASLNYGECDTAMRNCATEWSLRVTATPLLKKRRHGLLQNLQIFSQKHKAKIFELRKTSLELHYALRKTCQKEVKNIPNFATKSKSILPHFKKNDLVVKISSGFQYHIFPSIS